jgi:hypothetical protein
VVYSLQLSRQLGQKKAQPFTSHGHTLSQSCILSQVMDILYRKVVSFHRSWTYFITKLYPFTSHGHTLSQSCILSQVMYILYHKVVSFHKSWTYFITKLYPFTSHGHTLSQSCILSQVMDILYHKVESSTPCCGQEANSTSVCIGRYSSSYLAIVASMTPD